MELADGTQPEIGMEVIKADDLYFEEWADYIARGVIVELFAEEAEPDFVVEVRKTLPDHHHNCGFVRVGGRYACISDRFRKAPESQEELHKEA